MIKIDLNCNARDSDCLVTRYAGFLPPEPWSPVLKINALTYNPIHDAVVIIVSFKEHYIVSRVRHTFTSDPLVADGTCALVSSSNSFCTCCTIFARVRKTEVDFYVRVKSYIKALTQRTVWTVVFNWVLHPYVSKDFISTLQAIKNILHVSVMNINGEYSVLLSTFRFTVQELKAP